MAKKTEQRRILIVDGDPHAIGGITRVFGQLKIPYESILEASTGKQVLGVLRKGTKEAFDIVVVAASLPDMKATDFIPGALRICRAHPPRIIATSPDIRLRDELKKAGANAFVRKLDDPMHPINPSIMTACVKTEFEFLDQHTP